jgi:multiple sugar transport system permease protein
MSRDVDVAVAEPQAGPRRPATRGRPPRVRRSLAKTAAYLVLVALALFAIVPFSWLALAAFDRQASIFVKVPERWTLGNFVNLFVNEDGLRLILNSLIYSGGATLVLVVVATMAGYVLSRYQFPGRRTFMLGILLLRVIPPTAIIAPLYVIATGLGFLDTYYGVTLVLASWQLPLALWLMKGFFDTVPIQIEEAAWVDGATRLQAARWPGPASGQPPSSPSSAPGTSSSSRSCSSPTLTSSPSPSACSAPTSPTPRSTGDSWPPSRSST